MSKDSKNDSNASTQDPKKMLKEFPTGKKAQNELKKLLSATVDPAATIQTFQTQNSLHQYLAKAFHTTPQQNVSGTSALSANKKRTTRNEIKEKILNESKGVVVEPFQPESVLTFCNYLGVSRFDMYKNISDSLKAELENEIEKANVAKNKDALLEILASAWFLSSVPELRSVFLTVMKKLGDQTPDQVLVLLANKKKDGTLKYEDMLSSLSLDMKRLIWEADFDASVRGDGVPVEASSASSLSDVGTLKGTNIFIDVIRSPVQDYLSDESLRNAADLTYTGSFREKKVDTQKRRAVTVSSKEKAGSNSAGVTGKLSALTKNDKGSTPALKDHEEERKNVTGLALSSLKDVTGSRPKLLAAIVNILIAEHARNVDKENMDAPMKIVDGSVSLHCTLLSDILLSFGHLPRHYEHVRLLAQTLDECVQKGIVSDKAVSQIQECVRTIFQPDQDKEPTNATTAVKKEKQNVVKKKESSKNTNVSQNEAEKQFELKLLRKIIKGAVVEMKANDQESLFLNPVTDEIAPGYSRVIKNPMCMRTIEAKAVNLRYSTLGQYEVDVQLMFENCCRYNIGADGKWFRTEAKRQLKKWKDEILKQKKSIYKAEMTKRKKQLANAAGNTTSSVTSVVDMEERKKKDLLARQKQLSMIGTTKNVNGNKRKLDVMSKTNTNNAAKVQEITPLSESKAKKRKKDSSLPSIPALASMLLSDPFVVRLLFDKILRALKNDVITRDKNIPAEHGTIPSVTQLIHIANLSRKICAMKGKVFIVPDAGLVLQSDASDDGGEENFSESYAVLRKQMPKLAALLLTVDIDRRIAAGGDLQILPRLPDNTPEDWKLPTSSRRIILDLVEGSLVLLLQPGASNEAALLCQCPRFFVAISELSRSQMTEEGCFFASLSNALLRHKTKLPHSVRDMVVEAWLNWFISPSDKSCMTSSVHLSFLKLLNEWSSMGNVVLPTDRLISLAEDAAKAAVATDSKTFEEYWNNDESDEFLEIKSQYERMLRVVPEDRRIKWEKMFLE